MADALLLPRRFLAPSPSASASSSSASSSAPSRWALSSPGSPRRARLAAARPHPRPRRLARHKVRALFIRAGTGLVACRPAEMWRSLGFLGGFSSCCGWGRPPDSCVDHAEGGRFVLRFCWWVGRLVVAEMLWTVHASTSV
jgi:hypothetical protein